MFNFGSNYGKIENGKLIINEGTKVLDDSFAYSFFGSKDRIQEVVLPDGLQSIPDHAFGGYKNLKKVNFPKSLKNLSNGAFAGTALESVEIPETIKDIFSAFGDCHELVSVKLPANLSKISQGAFCNCENLSSFQFPTTKFEIDNYAFCGCSSIKNLILPKNCTKVHSRAFLNCDLDMLVVSDKTEICENAFLGTKIKCLAYCEGTKRHVTSLGENEEFISNKKGIFIVNEQENRVTGMINGEVSELPYLELMELKNYFGFISDADISDLFVFKKYMKQNNIENDLIDEDFATRLLQIYGADAPQKYFTSYSKWEYLCSKSSVNLFYLFNSIGLFSGNDYFVSRAISFLNEHTDKLNLLYLSEDIRDIENTADLRFNERIGKFFFDNRKEFDENGFKDSFVYLIKNFDEIQNSWKNKSGKLKVITLDYLNKYILNQAMIGEDKEDKQLVDFFRVACRYYYSKNELNTLKNWFNINLSIQENIDSGEYPNYFGNLKSYNEDAKYNFEFLRRDNPNYLFLGNICDCCARIGGAGESILSETCSDISKNFLVIYSEGRIIGKSSCIYDKENSLIILNNIEINNNFLKTKVMAEDEQEILSVLSDACLKLSQRISKMENKESIDVIIGNNATNDLFPIIDAKLPSLDEAIEFNGYDGYISDCEINQNYIIKDGKKTFEVLEETEDL